MCEYAGAHTHISNERQRFLFFRGNIPYQPLLCSTRPSRVRGEISTHPPFLDETRVPRVTLATQKTYSETR